MRFRLHELFTDERAKLSAARLGLWITVGMALVTVGFDVYMTWLGGKATIPNTVYSLEATMFLAFASWAGGPRIAQYLGPQIGVAASGIAAAVRDKRLPSKMDDERAGGQ